MTTRLQLRNRIRDELDDAAATKLWPDALLNQWIDDAIGAYSGKLPKASSTTLTTVANQAEYSIPADLLRVESVEWPAETFLAPHSFDTDLPTWLLWPAGKLTVSPKPAKAGESITLRYWARYALPTADTDVLAIPAADDGIQVDLVCWRALLWVSANEAKRQRFESGRGASAATEAQRYLDRATAEIHKRTALARRQLWPPG